jgi:hypothetical protein
MEILASRRLGVLAAVLTALATAGTVALAAGSKPFLTRLHTITTLSSAVPSKGSTKGDQNPYGVAVVRATQGALVRGDVLVSDFNDGANAQGTGSTIVQIAPNGTDHTFAIVPRPTSTPAVGLTTALVALKRGFVIVGSLPAPGGNSSKAGAGALTVLNSSGHVVSTITAPDINGPWDMTAVDRGSTAVLFVSNVLNGTVAAHGKTVMGGTVVRLKLSVPSGGEPHVMSNSVIAGGFPEHTDPAALVVGPTGVGLGNGGTLYVADSAGNRVAAVPNALTRSTMLGGGGMTVSSGGKLNDPLGLMVAPNGDAVIANGGNGNMVEVSPAGHQMAVKTLAPNGAGDLFGLALTPSRRGIYFVDDAGSGSAANSLRFLH